MSGCNKGSQQKVLEDSGSGANLGLGPSSSQVGEEYVPEKNITRLSVERESGSRAASINKRNKYLLPAPCIMSELNLVWKEEHRLMFVGCT